MLKKGHVLTLTDENSVSLDFIVHDLELEDDQDVSDETDDDAQQDTCKIHLFNYSFIYLLMFLNIFA